MSSTFPNCDDYDTESALPHHFLTATTRRAGGRQRKWRAAITQHGYNTARTRLGHKSCKTRAQHVQDKGTARARIAHGTCKTRLGDHFSKRNPPIYFSWKPKNCPSNSELLIRYFCTHSSKNRITMGILIFLRSTLQFVQILKPIREFLCTKYIHTL